MSKSARMHKPAKGAGRPLILPSASEAWKHLYGRRWQAASKWFRKRHPLCAKCDDAARVVDHIVAHKGDVTVFWDKTNWQALCIRCHNQKTAKEDGGFGNQAKGDG